jgi:oxygen-independent coproporphyrinogen-3 oxidase
MSKIDLTYAMRTVPRYTSYPTAPHFHSGIKAGDYAGWLRKLGPDDSLSLYLHVPFCKQICHYCGCHTKATRKEMPLIAYGRTLAQELELVAKHLENAGPVKHIHWGGGTPSLLPRESFIELAGLMRTLFRYAPDLEHAIELDPRLVSETLAETLAMIGVTRTSLGVQDFDLQVQEAIGRVQPFEVVEKATSHLRAAGLEALNFDLMYGLPHQTEATIRDTVEKTVLLDPGRIALFGYAHVPWMRKHQKLIDESQLPSPAERVRLAEIARQDLIDAGYVPIGLDHFARADDSMAIALEAGNLKRNFQGYTTDRGEQLIGFGVSSIGRLSDGYIQNMPDVGSWRRAILAGQLPVARGLSLSTDDLLRGHIIEQLMTSCRVDLKEACRAFETDIGDILASVGALDELAEDGLVLVEGDVVTVPPAGKPYVRLVAAAFDAYLADARNTTGARHSMAV